MVIVIICSDFGPHVDGAVNRDRLSEHWRQEMVIPEKAGAKGTPRLL